MSEHPQPLITELCPKPSSGSEWIELYNPSTQTVDLSNWQLWDQLSQPSLLYTFSDFSLAPSTFVVVEIGKKLNDTGDGVVLLDLNDSLIDSVSYQTAQLDLGYSRTALHNLATFEWQPASPNTFISLTISPLQPSPTELLVSPTLPLTNNTTAPTLTHTPTTTPTKSPSPSKTPTPIKTPTIVLITTPTNSNSPPISTHPLTQPTRPLPTITPKPPDIPPLHQLVAQHKLDPTASESSSHSQPAVPQNNQSRLVFFPSTRNPTAALNVIIGSLIICCHAGLSVWLDWRKNRVDDYF